MPRNHSGLFAPAIACLLLLLASCGHHKSPRESSRQWEPYIAGYTTGLVSRESSISVRLTNSIALESDINKPLAKNPFGFSPGIKGTAFYTDRNTIEFRPDKRLRDKQVYKASFDLSRFMHVPKDCRTFTFEFTTMEQMVDIRINGLRPVRADDLKWQQCTGTLVTADVDAAADVEKILHASQNGKQLSIRWEHADDRCKHSFTIDSIERGEKSSTLQLSWNGSSIKAKQAGSQEIHVPALDEFSVLDTKAIPGGEQQIVVRFSDPLLRTQNLAGLIQITGDNNPRFDIESNEIHIYPSQHINGAIDITINPGIRNIAEKKYKETTTIRVTIESIKPQVRFAGSGVVIPTSAQSTIPIEAVNLKSVDVRVIRIFEGNIPQFLQVNALDGSYELHRVGTVMWHKNVSVNFTADMHDRWIRCGIDLSALLSKEPNALYRIELRFTKQDAVYPCENSDTATEALSNASFSPADDEDMDDEHEYNEYDYNSEENKWENRDNPCKNRYYRENGGTSYRPAAARNVLVSDIGVLANRGAHDTLYITLTNLKTAQPIGQASIKIKNFQYQEVGSGESNGNGFCSVPFHGKPYLVIVESNKQRGYLRVDEGSILQESHFDVGGATVPDGLKGYLYGERGVWRPGDSLFLTFVLEDKSRKLPLDHPVTFELVNPRGQIIQTITRTTSVDRFYDFKTATTQDAPTGNYIARVKVGGATFENTVKVETVMPNRLKVKLDFGADTIFLEHKNTSGALSTRWLHGAVARNLKADVELRLEPASTCFTQYKDFCFDDPVRKFSFEPQKIFNGEVDVNGNAHVPLSITTANAPGMLSATFKTRVFEPGGAFSTDRYTVPVSPFSRYVGIRLPKPDVSWGAYSTDSLHTVQIATISGRGAKVSVKKLQVQLYKVDWHWWWERSEQDMSDFITSPMHKPVASGTVSSVNGEATWSFKVSSQNWGRYLVRVTDTDGGHATGTFLYIDWIDGYPRSDGDAPGGAAVLALTSDKPEYPAGAKAMLTIPSSENTRILVSLENGSTVCKQFWVNGAAKQTIVPLEITSDMAPTIYVHATLLQPYDQTVNDLPIRMYGVIPLRVTDPATKISPVLSCPDVLRPGQTATFKVCEAKGKSMAYTLAIVDEGLLDLTRFKTPDLWNYFYQREALGVKTWDMFNLVSGAYGAKLERLLAIGGDEGLKAPTQKKGNRFPPMVRCIGPFHLKAGETAQHEIAIPQYVGSVRVMVVGGQNGAYGKTDKTVPVRKPLMILATLPRVLGPGETTKLPVSVFAMEKQVKHVQIKVDISGAAVCEGNETQSLDFKEPDESFISFEMKAKDHTGSAHVVITATSGSESARQEIDIDIRNPNRPMVVVIDTVLLASGLWKKNYTLPGITGTNSALVEMSRIPPLNLGRRLDYLISYPHGCVEQTTSAVFPQLFLDKVLDLSAERKADMQRNIQAGLDRLRSFQCGSGGFSYWPGEGDADAWATTYAGHFITEAKLAGYSLPIGMQDRWIKYQQHAASSWSGSEPWSQLTQAYRLYTLALAQKPELGAMNRLRETSALSTATRWRLAAAYQLSGQPEIAKSLVNEAPLSIEPYRELWHTYGSDVRDEAMILETMSLMKDLTRAAEMAKKVSKSLSLDEWMSTQSTAYALLALSKFTGSSGISGKIDFTLNHNNKTEQSFISNAATMQQKLDITAQLDGIVEIKNRSNAVAYARLILKGTPIAGKEIATHQGIVMSVSYKTKDGAPVNTASIEQGTDFIAEVSLSADASQGDIAQVALSQIFPSGWEIRNTRFDEAATKESSFDYRDIRDDRVYTYCSLNSNNTKQFTIELNAAYIGRYYLPAVYAEAMYDETINACAPGMWVEVKEAGK